MQTWKILLTLIDNEKSCERDAPLQIWLKLKFQWIAFHYLGTGLQKDFSNVIDMSAGPFLEVPLFPPFRNLISR